MHRCTNRFVLRSVSCAVAVHDICPYLKVSFTLSRFSAPAWLRCGHRGQPGPHRSTALNRDKTCWNGNHREVAPVVSKYFKQPGLIVTQRGAKQRRLIPGHQRSSYGMIRISTVVNRHELCSRWRYGDYRFGHGKTRWKAGVAPSLVNRTTVWYGSSRWMPVKWRWRNELYWLLLRF